MHLHKHRIFTNKLVAGLGAIVAAFVFTASPAHAINFTDREKALLKAGKVIKKLLPSSGKKGFYGGSGFAVINEPLEVVWKALMDWEAYTKMFPNTEICKPISVKGNKTLLKMKIGHPVVNVEYHAEMKADAAKKTLSFDMQRNYPHDLNSIKGYWRLFPQSNGRTLAAYVVAVEAPMGIVSIAGNDLANRAIRALLHIPGDVKQWVEGPNGVKYKK